MVKEFRKREMEKEGGFQSTIQRHRLFLRSYSIHPLFSRFHPVTPLPPKGPSAGSIVGGIIGVLIFLAIIGTIIALYRKCANKKLSRDGPPKYKPPPPDKTNSSASRVNIDHVSGGTETLLQNQYYSTQSAEPVTDLDAFDDYEKEHYFSAASSGWDDPENNEALPPYMQTGNDYQGPDEHNVDSEDLGPADQQGTNVHRGDSFMSPPVFV
ncbi:hypothetical protein EXN66_Car007781 [Channa argus]|uniref:Uncharacterized protein n=1 Tax=Channa argus TaxID=215402 RepID=A0A6G1PPA3_CHAAH|nr:hypothetical protein EXN66_Car007781 [Channa argus]